MESFENPHTAFSKVTTVRFITVKLPCLFTQRAILIVVVSKALLLYSGRVAHQNAFAHRVELVSSSRSAHPPAPTAPSLHPLLTFAHPLLRPGLPLLSRRPVLAALSASCELELVNFRRRTPARWRGARAGSLGSRIGCQAHAMPSPLTVSHKESSAALVLSVLFCLPVHLGHVVLLLFVSQYAFSAPSLRLAKRVLGHSLPSYLFFPSPRSRVHVLRFVQPASSVIGNADEEVSQGSLSASSREGFWHQ